MVRLFNSAAIVAVTLTGLAVVGCGQSGPGERQIEVREPDKIDEVKSVLSRYAEGQPLGSEADDFDRLIEGVRETDPKKADMLAEEMPKLKQLEGRALQAKAKAIIRDL